MKTSAEIPIHRLEESDFFAAHAEGVSLGDFKKNHRIDFFAMIWFGSDEGIHLIDFEAYPIRRDDIYLLAPNQVHAIPGDMPSAKVFLFNMTFFESIAEESLRFMFVPFQNESYHIPEAIQQIFTQLFELILTEHRSSNSATLLQHYVSAFLTHLSRINSTQTSHTADHDDRLRKLFSLISTHFRSHKMADFYADQIGLTARRLNQILKNKMGVSVSQLIYSYTLIDAKREISHGIKPLKEIAIDLGFKDQSYFSRFFKKHSGVSPEHFRQQGL